MLEARDHRFRARILDAVVEPERQQIAAPIECLDGLTLVLVDEELFAFRSQEIANLFCNGAIGGIKRSEWIGWRRGLVCRDRGIHSGGRLAARGRRRGRRRSWGRSLLGRVTLAESGSGLAVLLARIHARVLCAGAKRSDKYQSKGRAGENAIITAATHGASPKVRMRFHTCIGSPPTKPRGTPRVKERSELRSMQAARRS